MASPRDLVLALSLETWDDVVRRQFARPPDRMLAYVRDSDRVDHLLVVNPWRSLAGRTKRSLGRSRDHAFPRTDRSDLLRPVRLRKADPLKLAALERSYAAYSALIRHKARRMSLWEPDLITFSPILAGFGDLSGFRSVTYVARDDWAAVPRLSPFAPAFRLAYDRIRDRGLKVSAVSEVLMERLAPVGPHRVVPNGVDPNVWSSRGAMPSALSTLIRPIAMYTGTIDDRLSLEALIATVGALRGGSLVLVGPSEPRMRERILAALPETHFISSVGQKDLAALVSYADVCVIPHVRSPLTEAMSPLKAYEYIAAGRPVVATDLLPIREVHPSVLLASDDSEFESLTRIALATGPLDDHERLDFIEANAWAQRCGRILELAQS